MTSPSDETTPTDPAPSHAPGPGSPDSPPESPASVGPASVGPASVGPAKVGPYGGGPEGSGPYGARSGRALRAADLARIAVFAALIAALGLPGTLTFFGNAVPITAQTLGVMLAGALLGARRGALACLVFLALVAAGLPLLAGGRGGLAVFTSPTVGYLIGFPVGAFVIGWLTERTLPHYRLWTGIVINVIGGIAAVYALGVPLQAWRVGSGLIAVVQGAVQFLPGDLIKAVVAALVAQQVHRAYPGLISRDGDG